jgi:hypothetical protein
VIAKELAVWPFLLEGDPGEVLNYEHRRLHLRYRYEISEKLRDSSEAENASTMEL